MSFARYTSDGRPFFVVEKGWSSPTKGCFYSWKNWEFVVGNLTTGQIVYLSLSIHRVLQLLNFKQIHHSLSFSLSLDSPSVIRVYLWSTLPIITSAITSHLCLNMYLQTLLFIFFVLMFLSRYTSQYIVFRTLSVCTFVLKTLLYCSWENPSLNIPPKPPPYFCKPKFYQK